MPIDVGIAAASSAAALALSFGLAALHYRRTARALKAALRRYVDIDAETFESDARHRVMLDHAPIGCVVWEPGFRIVEWNRQAELIFGWRRDEALGRHLIETLFREEDRPGVRSLATQLFAGGTDQRGALTHVGRDGGTVVCEWHHAAVRDRNGNPVRIVSMCLDVTGVREIERENALFRALVEHTSDPAVLLLDEQDGYRVKYANAAAGRHFGRPVDDLIGTVPTDWDPRATARSLACYGEAARRDGVVAVETEHRRADGTVVPVELTGNAIEHAGRAYVICYVRDISRRRADEARMRALEVSAAVREHEKRYREVFEHSSDALFSIDVSPQGGLAFASINPAAERAFGLPAAALAGLRLDDVAARPTNYIDASRKCVETAMPVEYEGPLDLASAGTQASLQYVVRLIPLAGDAGIERIIGIGRDVTERNRIENVLNFVAQRRWTDAVGDSLGALARHLGEMLAVDYVIVDRLAEEPGVAETAALYARGTMLPSMRYELRGTPCDNVLGKTLCGYPKNIQSLFPDDALLVDMKAESYVGIPLWDSAGTPIGLIAIIDGKPMEDTDAVARLLQLVATRVAAELERERADRQLRERERDFRSLAENSPDHIARYTPDGRFAYVNPRMAASLGMPIAALVGRTPAEAFPDGSLNAVGAHVQAAGRDGLASEIEAAVPTALGDVRYYNIAIVPERSAEGGIASVLTVGRDVTEQKQAHRHMALLTRALNHLNDGSVLIKRDALILNANRAFCAMLGYERNELVGRPIFDVLTDITVADWQSHWDGLLAKGGADLIETANRAKDGHAVPVEVSISLFEFEGETYNLAAVRDITERKRMEALLEARERDFRSLADNIPDNVARWDTEGRYLYINPTQERVLGASAESIVGTVISGVFDEIKAAIAQIAATGEPVVVRQNVPARNGEFEIHEVSLVPERDRDGRIVSVLGLGRDMTELFQMQEALAARERDFRSLAENSPNLIARFDRQGRRLYVNGVISRLRGLAPEALIGGSVDDGVVLTGDQTKKLSSIVRQAIATGQTVRDEVEIVDRDGVRRVFQGQVVPEFGPNGEVESVLAIGHDVTTFRDAERLVSRFVTNMPGFAFTLHRTPDGRYGFPFASPGIEKLFGLRPKDVKDEIGPLRRMLHVGDGLDFDARLAAAAKNLASLQFEFRIAGLDGNERWIEVRGTPERESDGGILWHGVMLNVTTRKRMENDLRQRELEFRALAENSPDPIFRYDPQGRRLFANRAAASLTRMTPEDLIGKSLTEHLIIPAAVAEQVRRVIATVVETGQPQECEIDFIGPVSGVRRVMQNRYVPEFGSYGRVVSVLSMSRDITRLKETLETLSHRERSLAEAQRMGRIGSWELDLVANRLDWSDEVFRIFEIDQARFDASYEAFLGAIHPEDRDAVNAAYTHSLETREAYSIDHRLLMPDGRVKYVHERCETEYDADGKPQISRGTVQDVTERTLAAIALRQREQEFRTLAENSPDIIVRYDLLGRRTYVNQAYLASNRVAKEQVLGKTVAETAVFPSALTADFGAMLARVIAGARDDELSMTWRGKDGETVSYFLRAVPEFGDDGEVASVLTVARDVTMLKETERRLIESRAELQELAARREDAREEERRRIARDLHEELGQTLSALRMNISMLPLEYAAAVPELRPRTASMLTLTDRVIHGMRQAVMTLRPTALDAGIAAGLEWLAREFEEHIGIPCALRLDDDRVEVDDRDATTLFRIAQEALANVARHARASRAELTLRRQSQGWLLEVRDDGCGFDPEIVHEKAFGLRSMTERAQSIGGQLSILSSPGDGTVVTLRISR